MDESKKLQSVLCHYSQIAESIGHWELANTLRGFLGKPFIEPLDGSLLKVKVKGAEYTGCGVDPTVTLGLATNFPRVFVFIGLHTAVVQALENYVKDPTLERRQAIMDPCHNNTFCFNLVRKTAVGLWYYTGISDGVIRIDAVLVEPAAKEGLLDWE